MLRVLRPSTWRRRGDHGFPHPVLAADGPGNSDEETPPDNNIRRRDSSAYGFMSTDSPMDRIFFPLNENPHLTEKTTLILYFHGLAADGKYACDSEHFTIWLDGQIRGHQLSSDNHPQTTWLRSLEADLPDCKVYAASYEQYVNDNEGMADLYVLGQLMFDGFTKIDEKKICQGPVILIGHSVGGLVLKQFIVEAELREKTLVDGVDDDRSLSLLQRLVGIFYFSTPHSDSADLTRLVGRTKSPVGMALATLGSVTQRLNHQFLDRRRAWKIPTAAVFEDEHTKVGSFNDLVVTERSARMDVDVAVKIAGTDHFSICKFNAEERRYTFLKDQIAKWVKTFEPRSPKPAREGCQEEAHEEPKDESQEQEHFPATIPEGTNEGIDESSSQDEEPETLAETQGIHEESTENTEGEIEENAMSDQGSKSD
ncbi:hypothetical protein R1sor_008399 [Riccia sorocarpa]|uniref:DUF676 domain-containing protein n=1 Tax=Riccia sorocarpa TaxID=122646 RepID=A0ABD3HTN0_9MARC